MNIFTTHRAGMRIAVGAAAACLLSALSVGAATAATLDDEVPSLAVKYDPRSLATESGARTLYRQLVSASRQVCPLDTGRDLHLSALVRQCQKESVGRAVNQINDPRLAEVYAGSMSSG